MSEKLGHQAQQREVTIGEWRRSVKTWGFWWRTITSLGMYYLVLWRRNQITLTNRRVAQRRGNVLGGDETTMNLENITDISLDIPPMGAMFNYGHITIQSAGSTGAEISFKGLGGAKRLRETIFDLQDGKVDEVKD